jgi:hypothetical protein
MSLASRKKKQEEEMSQMLWRVDYIDVKFSKYKRGLGSQVGVLHCQLK